MKSRPHQASILQQYDRSYPDRFANVCAQIVEAADPEATSTAVDETAAPALEKPEPEAQEPEEATTEEAPKSADGNLSEIVEPEEAKAAPEAETAPPAEKQKEER